MNCKRSNRVPFYFENFSGRSMPPGWREWNGPEHPATWDNQLDPIARKSSVIFGDPPDLAHGALYHLGQPYVDLTTSFLFKVPAQDIPQGEAFEVIDIYDGDFNEICDLYLHSSEKLWLSLNDMNLTDAVIPSPPPKREVIRVWLRFRLAGGLIEASAEWAYPRQCERRSGLQYVSLRQAQPGQFPNPVAREILFGPWHGGFHGIYTDVSLAGLAQAPPVLPAAESQISNSKSQIP